MDIEGIRNICNTLPFVTEDIKWGNDLCFSVGEKMFCAAALITPLKVSLKVPDEDFDEISNRKGVSPAPYIARYKWILIEDMNIFTQKQWENHIRQSYNLVKAKLPKNKLPGS